MTIPFKTTLILLAAWLVGLRVLDIGKPIGSIVIGIKWRVCASWRAREERKS